MDPWGHVHSGTPEFPFLRHVPEAHGQDLHRLLLQICLPLGVPLGWGAVCGAVDRVWNAQPGRVTQVHNPRTV